MGAGDWVLHLVGRHGIHGAGTEFSGDHGYAGDSGYGRIGFVPVVLAHPGEPVSGAPPRIRQCPDRRGDQNRAGDWNPGGRVAGEPTRLAAVLSGAGAGQHVVADSVVCVDAAGQGRLGQRRPHRYCFHARYSAAALGLVQRLRTVLHQLLLVLPDYLAAGLYGEGAAFPEVEDGGAGLAPVPGDRGFVHPLGLEFGPPDCERPLACRGAEILRGNRADVLHDHSAGGVDAGDGGRDGAADSGVHFVWDLHVEPVGDYPDAGGAEGGGEVDGVSEWVRQPCGRSCALAYGPGSG